jgi:phosphonoacetaldehyde hydrolase
MFKSVSSRLSLPLKLTRNISILPKISEYSSSQLDALLKASEKYRYKGPLKTVILDWSGTLVDAYVLAPAVVFVDVFKKFGINMSMTEARGPMGLRKDLHIGELLKLDSVQQQWFKKYNVFPGNKERDRLFGHFISMQIECLPTYSKIIPGADVITRMLKKDFDLKLGLSTGFTKGMSDVLRAEAEKQGVILDTTVAGDEVESGARPSPSMINKNLDRMKTNFPIQSVLKVDDTVSGIGEGINAGCWTAAVYKWSTYMNIDSLEQAKTLTKEELDERSKKSKAILEKSGAHYVIDDITKLPYVVQDINYKLRNGIQPTDPNAFAEFVWTSKHEAFKENSNFVK